MDFEEGVIRMDGLDIRRHPLECKRMPAYIFDNPDLYEFLTGIQYGSF